MRTRGSIQQRGRSSWRIRYEVERGADGKRKTKVLTFRGSRRDAQKKLTELLAGRDSGSYVDPSRLTLGQYLNDWLAGRIGLAAKTIERHAGIVRLQINPFIGGIELQRLRPADIDAWLKTLRASGGKNGKPLAAATVTLAHHVLCRGLQRAFAVELTVRNAAAVVKPPPIERDEVKILRADEIAATLAALRGHPLETVAIVALLTGMRRGELLALAWEHVDLGKASLRVERSLSKGGGKISIKSPKTKAGRRTISLPPTAVSALQTHKVREMERRFAAGVGRIEPGTLVFGNPDGTPINPDYLSRDWANFVREHKLPDVTLHALRHTHASGLIASGVDVVRGKRLGHADPAVTLKIYAHAFDARADAISGEVIEAALMGRT
jgi:integrase